MKRIHQIAAAVALCMASTLPALAQSSGIALVNPGFDQGTNDLDGWDVFGDVTVLGGVKRAVLSTASFTEADDFPLSSGFNNNSGNSPVDFAVEPDLAGVPLSSLDTHPVDGPFVTEGSAIRQSFAATAGDIVTVNFEWAFLTMEPESRDYAFVALNDTVVRFADTNSANTFAGAFGDFNNVNWVWTPGSFSYTANTSGIQSLALGVVDMFDYNNTSELRVDNILVQITAVPEPETYAMLLAGLGLVGAFTRRRKAQASQA